MAVLIKHSGGNQASLQIFLIISTCFLYLVAAGLFSKAVWYFGNHQWSSIIGGDASEVGSGPGSYDIRQSVWHLNFANPEINGGGGWGIFNAIFGWTNSATYGSVISYNLYWLVVIIAFVSMRYKEQHGHLPLMKAKAKTTDTENSDSETSSQTHGIIETSIEKKGSEEGPSTAVREIEI